MRVEGPPHQHHRHARPRRLHRRGRALRCASSTARSPSSTPSPASSRSRRPSGGRPTSTASRGSPSSTRWTGSAPTSRCRRARRSASGSGRTRCRSSCRSGPRTSSRGSSTSSRTRRSSGRTTSGSNSRSRTSRPSMADAVAEARGHLIEACADVDDELMEMYLEEAEIPNDRLREALRAATLELSLTPVLCGSAFKNKGVQPLLDCDHRVCCPRRSRSSRSPASSPSRGEEEGNPATRPADDDGPFAALAFKVMTDPFVGKLTYFRVYSGKLERGRPRPQQRSTADRADRPAADDARELARGDRRSATPATSSPASASSRPRPATRFAAPDAPIMLEQIEFPEPVIDGRDRAEDEGRPGEAREGAAAARRGGPDVPSSTPTRRPARP